ncbi:MAG: hypothetical protein ABI047_09940 [Jatrophihabitantaceae bacterium]
MAEADRGITEPVEAGTRHRQLAGLRKILTCGLAPSDTLREIVAELSNLILAALRPVEPKRAPSFAGRRTPSEAGRS